MKLIFILITFLLFIGCGGSSGSSSSKDSNQSEITDTNKTYQIQGKVVDGYISGASVCIDEDNNGICTQNDITVQSDINGTFVFDAVELANNTRYTILASGGTDTFINQIYDGVLQSVCKTDKSSKEIIISPLSDLIVTALKQSDSFELAQQKIINLLHTNINQEDLEQNIVENTTLFIQAQAIEFLKVLLFEIISHYELSLEKAQIQEKIKQTIILSSSLYESDSIIENLELQFSISLLDSHKLYLEQQLIKNKNLFDGLVNVDITSFGVQNLQVMLYEDLSLMKINLQNSVYDTYTFKIIEKITSLLSIEINQVQNKSYNTPPALPKVR
ncbi:MAG TPA: hypothetical protein ENK66_04185 [Arcobacter sp.]|jgi:hypothetical protein|nr:hypothetical protein [Arcobacter sp.]